jgi:hypothetical protein
MFLGLAYPVYNDELKKQYNNPETPKGDNVDNSFEERYLRQVEEKRKRL